MLFSEKNKKITQKCSCLEKKIFLYIFLVVSKYGNWRGKIKHTHHTIPYHQPYKPAIRDNKKFLCIKRPRVNYLQMVQFVWAITSNPNHFSTDLVSRERKKKYYSIISPLWLRILGKKSSLKNSHSWFFFFFPHSFTLRLYMLHYCTFFLSLFFSFDHFFSSFE